MANAVMFFGTGYEEIEALAVVDILRRAEIPVSMVSVTGEKTVVGSHNIEVSMDLLFDEVDFAKADVLILPGGGAGTKMLEAYTPLMEKVDEFVKAGKLVAAICAAPSILGHRGHLRGKKACSYPTFESHLEGAEVLKQPAVTDGNIVTGRGMGAAIDFGLAILEKIEGKDVADKMAETIVYANRTACLK